MHDAWLRNNIVEKLLFEQVSKLWVWKQKEKHFELDGLLSLV